MSAKICNYFVASNSSRGFINYFEDNVRNLEKLYVLKGCSDSFKSSLIKNVGIDWFIKGYDIEYIHSPEDEKIVEAVIIPALNTGVANGDIQYISESGAIKQKGEFICLEAGESTRAILLSQKHISGLNKKIKKYYKKANKLLEKALKIRNKWEKLYTYNVSLEKVCNLVDNTIKKFLSYHALKKEGMIRNRFLGGLTHKGYVDFLKDLTKDVGNRYIIKGYPGPGKSILLQNLANTVQERGFDVELYHNCFDPARLDMVIVREMDLAVFDCTESNEVFGSRDGDEIIDISPEAVNQDTDEAVNQATDETVNRETDDIKKFDTLFKNYKEAVNDGVVFLKKAKEAFEKIEDEIKESIDLKEIDKVYSDILEKIKKAVK